MTSYFVCPSFAPPTLEQLTAEPDEVSLIRAQEGKIHQELTEVRDYNREQAPLGVIPVQEELAEAEEGLSDEELTEEEEEEEEEEDEEGEEDDDIDDQGTAEFDDRLDDAFNTADDEM